MANEHPSLVTAGELPNPGEIDRSASGLQFQRYQMGLTAKGSALGMGRRVAVDPSSQFTHPPMSASQFGSSTNARASVSSEEGL